MREIERTLFLSYLYKNQCRLENNVKSIKEDMLFHGCFCSDALELALAIQELETFRKVSADLRLLLKLDKAFHE